MQEKRLAKLEAGLKGTEKVLAWMHRAQQLGGFEEVITRDSEANNAFTKLIIEDVDSAFLHMCVVACNGRALELRKAHMERGLLYLCVQGFLRTGDVPADELEVQAFRRLLKVFVLKGMLFERVLKIISEDHFFGMNILFDDEAEGLAKDNQDAEILCSIFFNQKLAPRLGVEPITADELEECLRADAPKEAEAMTTLARADAELMFGNRRNAVSLLVQIIRGYEPKARADGFQQIATDYLASLQKGAGHPVDQTFKGELV